MTVNDTTDRVAALHDLLDDKKKAAEDQLLSSKERLADSSLKPATKADLRDLLNKLRLTWRDPLVHDEVSQEETT